MKKIYLFAAMALIMMGCSSNDEENYPADELLAGTEWRYGTFHDDDFLDQKPNEEVNEETYYDKFLEDYFPDVELVCTIGEVSSTEEEDESQDGSLQSRSKLTFTNRDCIYPKSVIRKKTPSICKHTPLFLCVIDNRNFLIARKYSELS